MKGVNEVISGFTAGTTKDPKYIPGQWGDHREAALVKYNPKIISFKELVVHVFKTIDYEDNNGQFCERRVRVVVWFLLKVCFFFVF